MKASGFFKKNVHLFSCPNCHGKVSFSVTRFTCHQCRQSYEVIDNIPRLFLSNEWHPSKSDVTETIKAFYEKVPFPDYDDDDNTWSLIEKARRGVFAQSLDEQIPYDSRILDCGCGTGQLTNFLSLPGRTVIGTDICLNSLRMGQKFKEKNDLEGSFFVQMNLFRPCFVPASFDLVIANGVLHHTSDPFAGFQSIAELVRADGYIIVGLYHRYGRRWTDMRRVIFRATGEKLQFLDRRLRDKTISRDRRWAWLQDQYRNPHESTHTVGEVLGWLERTGFRFIRSIPGTIPFMGLRESTMLFERERYGTRWERMMTDLGMLLGGREGGFFIVIGRRLA